VSVRAECQLELCVDNFWEPEDEHSDLWMVMAFPKWVKEINGEIGWMKNGKGG
jgi:hypothetical protein